MEELKEFGLDLSYVLNNQKRNTIDLYGYECNIMMLMQKLSLENDYLRLKHGYGVNINNLIGGSLCAVKNTFKNMNQYMSMEPSFSGYLISYGFTALNVGGLAYAISSDDYVKDSKT